MSQGENGGEKKGDGRKQFSREEEGEKTKRPSLRFPVGRKGKERGRGSSQGVVCLLWKKLVRRKLISSSLFAFPGIREPFLKKSLKHVQVRK